MARVRGELFKVGLAVLIRHPVDKPNKPAKAMLIEYEDNEIWIPYSQVSSDGDYMACEPGDTLPDFFIPVWLAKNKGML